MCNNMEDLPLIQELEDYLGSDFCTHREEASVFKYIAFLNRERRAFERTCVEGHVTASAWILNQTQDKCLLLHHRKLDRWLQLGGHADGDQNLRKVALKEASEESGLKSIQMLSNSIFDVDIHEIPANTEESAHLHYDVRFAFIADEHEGLVLNKREAKAVAWCGLSEVRGLTQEESVLRLVDKTSTSY